MLSLVHIKFAAAAVVSLFVCCFAVQCAFAWVRAKIPHVARLMAMRWRCVGLLAVLCVAILRGGAKRGTAPDGMYLNERDPVAVEDDEMLRDMGQVGETLSFTGIAIRTNTVSVALAWSFGMAMPDNAIDLYATRHLAQTGWWHVASAYVDSGVTNTTLTIDDSQQPTNAVSRLFLLAGTRHDSDGDSIPDVAERRVFGTDPALFDSDGDGLSDGEEVVMGTNPNSTDTDGDGLNDTFEVRVSNTDPLSCGIETGWGATDADFVVNSLPYAEGLWMP